ncbi:hypothetical protein X777_16070 [Ooceraea biroi]|uniref:Uncharacterized protein n=1 Tax=Ooceraea biroi TaxID=2015173 RepID=A0A026WV75_OOCBI|nr:hypothetical protein X777_16070 [Ooceraea biroi]
MRVPRVPRVPRVDGLTRMRPIEIDQDRSPERISRHSGFTDRVLRVFEDEEDEEGEEEHVLDTSEHRKRPVEDNEAGVDRYKPARCTKSSSSLDEVEAEEEEKVEEDEGAELANVEGGTLTGHWPRRVKSPGRTSESSKERVCPRRSPRRHVQRRLRAT